MLGVGFGSQSLSVRYKRGHGSTAQIMLEKIGQLSGLRDQDRPRQALHYVVHTFRAQPSAGVPFKELMVPEHQSRLVSLNAYHVTTAAEA